MFRPLILVLCLELKYSLIKAFQLYPNPETISVAVRWHGDSHHGESESGQSMEGALCLITTPELLTLSLPTHDWETGTDRHRVINNCVLQQSPYWLDCGLAPILINCVRIFRCGRQWPGTGQWLIVPVITLFVAGGESGIERRSSGGHPTSEWKSTAFIFNGFSHGRDSDLFGNWRLIWTKAWRLQSCWKLIHLRWDLNCCELSVDCG